MKAAATRQEWDDMADEVGAEFVMPRLSQRQREYIYGLLTGQDFYGRPFYGSLHGTLRKNLLGKGLVRHCSNPGWKLELTEFGRRVAEQVQEQEIRRAGARLAEEATRAQRQADADMRTPPPARPSYNPAPVAYRSLDAVIDREREIEQVMAWLQDSSRLVRIEQLQRCGHGRNCANCAELESMRRELERALIRLIGEVDSLKQQLGFSQLNLQRLRAGFEGLAEAHRMVLKAICASVGVGDADAKKTDT